MNLMKTVLLGLLLAGVQASAQSTIGTSCTRSDAKKDIYVVWFSSDPEPKACATVVIAVDGSSWSVLQLASTAQRSAPFATLADAISWVESQNYTPK